MIAQAVLRPFVLGVVLLPGSLSAAGLDTLGQTDRPWSIFALSRAGIQRFPYRSPLEAFSLAPSVVIQAPGRQGPAVFPYVTPISSYNQISLTVRPLSMEYDGLHVRGGRTGEIAYFVDGLPVTNRLFNAPAIDPIPEAIEAVELHVGPYSAEYGQGLSGLSLTRLRTGGDRFQASAEYTTDAFATEGRKFLGTSSFGYRSAVATIGGPIRLADTLRYFVAGRHYSQRDRQPMFLDPFRFDGLTDDQYGPQLRQLPGALGYDENTVKGNGIEQNDVQGNLRLVLPDITLMLTGAYRSAAAPLGSSWPENLYRYYDLERLPDGRERSSLLGLTATTATPSTSLRASVSWQKNTFDTYDPNFGTDWRLYSDSSANAAAGYGGFRSRWRGADPYSVIDGFRIAAANSPWTRYQKDVQQSWVASADIRQDLGNGYSLAGGFVTEWWTMRYFSIRDIPSHMEFLYGTLGNQTRTFTSDAARREQLARHDRIDNYGYTVDGTETNSGNDAPRTPFFGSAYTEVRYRDDRLSAGVGLRFEHVALQMPVPRSLFAIPFDAYADAIDENQLVDQNQHNYLLPRIDVRYQLFSGTSLRGAFGQYVGVPPLVELFHGTPLLNETVSPLSRGGAYQTPVGWEARPERCSHVEIGLTHDFTPWMSAGITAYAKKYTDLVAIRKIFNGYSDAPLTNALVNDAYANARGVELDITFKQESGLYADVRYALSEATGTDANVLSSFGEVEAGYSSPRAAAPLDFQQTHRGTAILGYTSEFRPGDPLLSGLDLALIISFSSGHPYTPLELKVVAGASNAWTAGVGGLLDPRFADPLQPKNSSTTPSVFTIDLALSKEFSLGPIRASIVLNVLNLLNTRSAVNLYPTTGSATDDGWLDSWQGKSFLQTPIPGYVDFYRAVNLANRWAYMSATGVDMYNQPRQVRLGMRIAL